MGMSGKVFLIVTIRHGQICNRLVVSLLVHVCPLSLLLVMCVGGVRGIGRCVLFGIYYFYITKFKYHLCYYLNLFAILAKGTVW